MGNTESWDERRTVTSWLGAMGAVSFARHQAEKAIGRRRGKLSPINLSSIPQDHDPLPFKIKYDAIVANAKSVGAEVSLLQRLRVLERVRLESQKRLVDPLPDAWPLARAHYLWAWRISRGHIPFDSGRADIGSFGHLRTSRAWAWARETTPDPVSPTLNRDTGHVDAVQEKGLLGGASRRKGTAA